MSPERDPRRFAARRASPRGVDLVYLREGQGVPLVLLHGWPSTRRLWWRNVASLADSGFDVVAPDLRGFGDSDPGSDGYGDVASHSLDMYGLLRGELGFERVCVAAGDFGGAIAQDLSLRFPGFVDRLVLYNAPLPELPEHAELRTRAPREALHYFFRQARDAEGLARELATPEARIDYIRAFYDARRAWAHASAFDAEAAAFHAEPFRRAETFRAGLRLFESLFDAEARIAEPLLAMNPTPTAILFATQDRVVAPDFDRMAAAVFPNHAVQRIDGAGHFLPWESPEVFARNVVAHCLNEPESRADEARAYIGLGSNLGFREAALAAAIVGLRETPGVRDVVPSRIYESDPVGPGDQGTYLNAVVRVETTLSPRGLLERLQELERAQGRVRSGERNEARTLDLDLLFYGDACVSEPGLDVPHPRAAERPFVLEPLNDLAPRFVHPELDLPIETLAARVRDTAAVRLRGASEIDP